MIAWLLRLLGSDIKPPRELIFVSYIEADRKLRSQTGWRLAPEEDRNRQFGMVYLERDAPMMRASSCVPLKNRSHE